MGIREMEEKKRVLESHIFRLVDEFEKSTSLVVESININHRYITAYGEAVINPSVGVLRDIKIKAFLE